MNIQFPSSAAAPTLLNGASAGLVSDQPEESFQQVFAQAASNGKATSGGKAAAGGKVTSDDKKLADAAKQFEGVIAAEVLKAARSSSQSGWLGLSGSEDDQTGEMTLELAEQGLAQGLGAAGALGIAKMVVSNLHRSQSTHSNSAPGSAK